MQEQNEQLVQENEREITNQTIEDSRKEGYSEQQIREMFFLV